MLNLNARVSLEIATVVGSTKYLIALLPSDDDDDDGKHERTVTLSKRASARTKPGATSTPARACDDTPRTANLYAARARQLQQEQSTGYRVRVFVLCGSCVAVGNASSDGGWRWSLSFTLQPEQRIRIRACNGTQIDSACAFRL